MCKVIVNRKRPAGKRADRHIDSKTIKIKKPDGQLESRPQFCFHLLIAINLEEKKKGILKMIAFQHVNYAMK